MMFKPPYTPVISFGNEDSKGKDFYAFLLTVKHLSRFSKPLIANLSCRFGINPELFVLLVYIYRMGGGQYGN